MCELEPDTFHVFELILTDKKFEGILQSLTHTQAMQAVVEAFNILYTAPAPSQEHDGAQLDLTPEGCMVVALIQQIFVQLLTKRLMNLMTTEAVILNRNKIPYRYLEHYVNNQAHFSLKDAITKYHAALETTLL